MDSSVVCLKHVPLSFKNDLIWYSCLFRTAAAGEPQTDKAAIDEAEKRVGAKKDE